jgi:hypothetical protein
MSSKSAPPVKRLRLRGDWSDTGPNARPESEGINSFSSTQLKLTYPIGRTNRPSATHTAGNTDAADDGRSRPNAERPSNPPRSRRSQ